MSVSRAGRPARLMSPAHIVSWHPPRPSAKKSRCRALKFRQHGTLTQKHVGTSQPPQPTACPRGDPGPRKGPRHPMGKRRRTPSVEARVVGTKQQLQKSKECLFTRLTFPLLYFYFSYLFPPSLLVLLFFYLILYELLFFSCSAFFGQRMTFVECIKVATVNGEFPCFDSSISRECRSRRLSVQPCHRVSVFPRCRNRLAA